MNVETKNIDQQISLLRTAYISKLPSKIAELEALWGGLKKGQADDRMQDVLQALAANAHKFAGSAGLYGLSSISEHARALESRCLLLDSENAILSDADLQALRSDVDAMLAVAEDADNLALNESELLAQSKAVSGTASSHQSIMIADADRESAERIANMLEDLGYATHIVVEVAKMEAALGVISPDAVIMDVNFERRQREGDMLVAQLRQKGLLHCPVIFWHEDESFDMRMRAVRAGGDGFFRKPADTFSIMDTLSQVLARNVANPLRVLLVDDDDEVTSYLKLMLTEAGFMTQTQGNAAEVLPDLYSFNPDIVLLDIAMPDFDGLELARMIRQTKEFSNVPIVFLTTYPAQEKRLKALEYGGDDYIQKDVRATELISSVLSRAERSRCVSTLISTLRASEERNRIVSYSGGECIIGVNDTGRVILWNHAAESAFGFTADEMIGRSVSELVIKEQAGKLEADLTSGTPNGGGQSRRREYECIGARGQQFSAELSIAHWTQFGHRFATVILRDISSRKHAMQEMERRASQNVAALELREAAINSATVGVAIINATDPNYPLEYVNRAFERMTGYAYDEAVGRRADFLLGSDMDQPELHTLRDEIAANRPARAVLRNYRRSGDMFWNELRITPVHRTGGVTHMVAILDDITAQKETDALLHQAQKMEAVGQLTGGIAHDFNNLLAVTVNSLQLLERKESLGDKERELIDEALAATDRSVELTRQLLSFSRQHTLQSQVVDINKTVNGTQRMLRRVLGETVDLRLEMTGHTWQADIDPALFETAIVNLAINARDAMSAMGRLTIRTRNLLADAVMREAQPSLQLRDYVVVEVSDTGKGIPPHILESIFDPFFTTKEEGEGTGLGLSMTHGFVKQSGGHIAVESTENVGTTFRLYFPREDGSAAADLDDAAIAGPEEVFKAPPPSSAEKTQAPDEAEEISPQVEEPAADVAEDRAGLEDEPASTTTSKTILLVEDEPLVRGTVLRVLSELGYSVIEMESGRDAVDFLADEENCALIDMVLSDVVMPGGVSGPELAEIAQVKIPGVHILLTSGYMGENLPDSSSFDLLPKPFDMKTLSQRIESILA